MRPIYTANGSTVFWVTGHFSTPPENWTVRPFLQLTLPLSNDFSAAWLTFTFPQLFAVAATLKSIDYNVAMAFILNNNSSVQLRQTWAHCTLASWLPGERPLLEIILWTQQCSSGVRSERKMLVLCSAVLTHHIRFWYLWCCGCPGLQGRQRLATPHTRSLHEFLSNGLTPSRCHIISHTCGPRLPWPSTISGAWKPQSRDGADARSGTLYVPVPPKTPSAKNSRDLV